MHVDNDGHTIAPGQESNFYIVPDFTQRDLCESDDTLRKLILFLDALVKDGGAFDKAGAAADVRNYLDGAGGAANMAASE